MAKMSQKSRPLSFRAEILERSDKNGVEGSSEVCMCGILPEIPRLRVHRYRDDTLRSE
jgi:hypothetical protein